MPEPRITLDQWRALVAVVDKGGYAKAAAALHKSQSSVTYGVQQLESQLGVKAFKVAGRKAELSPGGVSSALRPAVFNAFPPGWGSGCCTPQVTDGWLLGGAAARPASAPLSTTAARA